MSTDAKVMLGMFGAIAFCAALLFTYNVMRLRSQEAAYYKCLESRGQWKSGNYCDWD